ncbi:hypothetical protein SAMN05216268_107171 [Streptomyces yunnanensis]|uniref:Uncharacterized protein n=1 Tax=Streptomyces yunnanensis TaxID=156453 RepID=A0A9X8QTB2_9ACTN|nr:hypothetical protein SAMN05216268_107171 [Streptomyces yunnanensis]
MVTGPVARVVVGDVEAVAPRAGGSARIGAVAAEGRAAAPVRLLDVGLVAVVGGVDAGVVLDERLVALDVDPGVVDVGAGRPAAVEAVADDLGARGAFLDVDVLAADPRADGVVQDLDVVAPVVRAARAAHIDTLAHPPAVLAGVTDGGVPDDPVLAGRAEVHALHGQVVDGDRVDHHAVRGVHHDALLAAGDGDALDGAVGRPAQMEAVAAAGGERGLDRTGQGDAGRGAAGRGGRDVAAVGAIGEPDGVAGCGGGQRALELCSGRNLDDAGGGGRRGDGSGGGGAGRGGRSPGGGQGAGHEPERGGGEGGEGPGAHPTAFPYMNVGREGESRERRRS